ncbi:hypothetical protein AVEN_178926-1 [Araneus ventricosus]|uniref:Uncharacterized protein n=1 Tax=Araneus ventricosus TaxID=182803 RepID=A0A4Y2M4D0_ARAVE|nr:hypothetical protein AVEN_178926-1 [Araneus ventricosus]
MATVLEQLRIYTLPLCYNCVCMIYGGRRGEAYSRTGVGSTTFVAEFYEAITEQRISVIYYDVGMESMEGPWLYGNAEQRRGWSFIVVWGNWKKIQDTNDPIV